MTGSLLHGRVKLWLASKSYGFVQPEDGSKDVFFHASAIDSGTTVAEGDAVEYQLASGTKIPQATRVRCVTNP